MNWARLLQPNSVSINGLIFLLIISSSWFFFQIDVGGVTVTNITEALVIVLFAANFKYLGLLWLNRFWQRILIIGSLLALFWLLYSLSINTFSMAIGGWRRLVFSPLFGLLTGGLIGMSQIRTNSNPIEFALMKFPWVMLLLAMANLFIGFREINDLDLIMRPDAFFIIPLLFYFIYRGIVHKQRTWVMVMFLTFLVFATASRGVILTFIVGTIWLFWRILPGIVVIRGVTSFFSVLLLVVMSLYFSVPKVAEQVDREVGQIVSFSQGDYGGSGAESNNLALRYYRYQSALNSGLENPVFGGGLGHKADFYIGGPYQRVEKAKTAHNYLLTLWMKVGAFGIAIFLLVYFLPIFRTLNRSNWIVGLTFALAFFYSFFDVMMASTPSAFYGLNILAGYFIVVRYTHED